MKKSRLINMLIRIIIIGFLSSISFYSYSKNIPKLPLEYFTKIGQTKTIILSPDGKHYLVILEKDRKTFFAVINTKTNKKTSVIGMRSPGKTVADIHWISNERIIYGAREKYAWDKGLHTTGELFAVNIDGSQHDIIFRFGNSYKQDSSNMKVQRGLSGSFSILDVLPNDPKHILLTFYRYKPLADLWRPSVTAYPVVYKINTRNAKRRKVATLPIRGPNVSALTDDNNEVRFAMGVDKSGKLKVFYRDSKDDDWKNFHLKEFENSNTYPLSFAGDNQGVYFSANVDKGTDALFLFDFKSKKVQKIYQDKDVDIYSYIYDYKHKRIIAVDTENPLPTYHYLNEEDEKAKIHKKLRAAFAGNDIYITSASQSGDKIIVRVSSDKNAGDYYLLDTKTFEATYLSSNVSWVNPAYSGYIEPIQVTSRDGLLLNGYLTLPSQKSKSPLPLIVLPHGGPHGPRDLWGYDWETQLFANRGYAVLQINFRGSGGYGSTFQAKGYGKWGTEIQDDITDATNFVLKRDDIDASRVCIYGSSFGGYAALMGGIREPELYKCVIGSMGVYDLPLMKEKGNIAEYLISGQAYLNYAVGTEREDLRSRSPSHNADKLKANIMLIHGAQDTRVPIEQAESLMEALDKIGKTYEWLPISNEGHGFYELKNRNEVYSRILEFLDKNIGQVSN